MTEKSYLSIDVRSLAEFLFQEGSLGRPLPFGASAIAGMKAHKKIQERGIEGYRAEVPLSRRFSGERIDLEPLFREQFVLAIPYAPLCSETCKGLCPQCGIDRNTDSCACEPPIDPRLAALKGLKIPS